MEEQLLVLDLNAHRDALGLVLLRVCVCVCVCVRKGPLQSIILSPLRGRGPELSCAHRA